MVDLVDGSDAGDDVFSDAGDGGEEAAEDAEESGDDESLDDDIGSDLEADEQASGEFVHVEAPQEQPSGGATEDSTADGEAKRFGEDQAEEAGRGETESFENGQLLLSFADGHAHGAGGDEQEGEDDDSGD